MRSCIRLAKPAVPSQRSVIKAGTRFELLATNSIGEAVSASLAIADDRIYLRGDSNVYCIGRSR